MFAHLKALGRTMAIGGLAGGVLLTTDTEAAVFGTPIFTTAPASISVVNEFGPDLFPTDSFSVSVTTTIASSIGAPNLVGETLSMGYFFNNGFDPGIGASIQIAGIEVLVDPLLQDGSFLFGPPFSVTGFDPVTSEDIFEYAAPFQDFGPRQAAFPEIEMFFMINDPLPSKIGVEYETASGLFFSNTAGLSTFNGEAVISERVFSYTEGTISGGTITFSTPGGPPVSAVPLPAGGLLMLSGMAFAAGVLRRRKQRG